MLKTTSSTLFTLICVIMFVSAAPAAAKKLPNNIAGKNTSKIVEESINIVQEAGEILLKHYKKGEKVSQKKDASPVTKADMESNAYILSRLKKLTPDIPVISEETANIANPGNMFWLVDPMDGTKGFIRGTDQFTVNIALIHARKPILGFIHLPAVNRTYFTGADGLAYVIDMTKKDKKPQKIHVRKPASDGMEFVASSSHRSDKDESYIRQFNVKNFLSSHSSIKFCFIAEGRADIYPRFGTTMEWDTAAGQALILAAGGHVINAEDGKEFSYLKKDYRNGAFIAYGDIDAIPLPTENVMKK